MKFSIYFLILTLLAPQIFTNAQENEISANAEENVASEAPEETTQEENNNPDDTSLAVPEETENEKNCTKIIIVRRNEAPTFFLFKIPEIACVLNLVQIAIAVALKALDIVFIMVLVLRIGYKAIINIADEHLEVKNLLEMVGKGVNGLFSSAVGGIFNIIGLGEVAKVPIKLVSQVATLGLNVVDQTIGRIPIVGGLVSDVLGVASSIFRG